MTPAFSDDAFPPGPARDVVCPGPGYGRRGSAAAVAARRPTLPTAAGAALTGRPRRTVPLALRALPGRAVRNIGRGRGLGHLLFAVLQRLLRVLHPLGVLLRLRLPVSGIGGLTHLGGGPLWFAAPEGVGGGLRVFLRV